MNIQLLPCVNLIINWLDKSIKVEIVLSNVGMLIVSYVRQKV